MMKRFIGLFVVTLIFASQSFAFVLDAPNTRGAGKMSLGLDMGYVPAQNGGTSTYTSYGLTGTYGLNNKMDIAVLLNQGSSSSAGSSTSTNIYLGCNWMAMDEGVDPVSLAVQVTLKRNIAESVGSVSTDMPLFVYVQAGKRYGSWLPFAGAGYNYIIGTGASYLGADLGAQYDINNGLTARFEGNYFFSYSTGSSNSYTFTGQMTYSL